MKLSDYIVDFLSRQGCTVVFGYPGGAITHLLDSIGQSDAVAFVGTAHEQGAALAAEGYARVSGRLGVAIATSGPGATNLITGIGSSYFDSIPCLYLTGQVNTYEYKGDLGVRQLGFQETDIVSIAAPITKYAARVTQPQDIRRQLEQAVAAATQGRPGPALLDIPMDIQRAEIDPDALEGFDFAPPPKLALADSISQVIARLCKARRPVILAGGGVRLAGATGQLQRLCRKTRIPVITSLMGLDSCAGLPGFYGMLGAYGSRCANLAAANSDLILCLGSRLDSRQTGTNPASFARDAALIRVDIDPEELARSIKPEELAIQSDAADFLNALLSRSDEIVLRYMGNWLTKLEELRRRYPFGSTGDMEDPNYLMEQLSAKTTPGDVFCLDVGQNQMWAAQSLALQPGQRLLTSGGMGTMGFALPAAIGAWYARRSSRVFAISGDGGLQMNLQELALVRRENIPVKIIVLNNGALGMIRHFQEMYFGSRYFATLEGYHAPDFCAVAQAYGIPALQMDDLSQLEEVAALLRADGPGLIDIRLPRHTHVYPKLGVGRPVEDQEPLLPRGEFLSNMLVSPAAVSLTPAEPQKEG